MIKTREADLVLMTGMKRTWSMMNLHSYRVKECQPTVVLHHLSPPHHKIGVVQAHQWAVLLPPPMKVRETWVRLNHRWAVLLALLMMVLVLLDHNLIPPQHEMKTALCLQHMKASRAHHHS